MKRCAQRVVVRLREPEARRRIIHARNGEAKAQDTVRVVGELQHSNESPERCAPPGSL